MILLCYDGPADARAAIEHAGELLSGQPATVLTVREPFAELIARTPSTLGLAPGMLNIEEIDTPTHALRSERLRDRHRTLDELQLRCEDRRGQFTFCSG